MPPHSIVDFWSDVMFTSEVQPDIIPLLSPTIPPKSQSPVAVILPLTWQFVILPELSPAIAPAV